MFPNDIYTGMLDNDEAWFSYFDGCAWFLGTVNRQIALEC